MRLTWEVPPNSEPLGSLVPRVDTRVTHLEEEWPGMLLGGAWLMAEAGLGMPWGHGWARWVPSWPLNIPGRCPGSFSYPKTGWQHQQWWPVEGF